MFEFLKKKSAEPETPAEPAAAEPAQEKQINLDNIAIHTIPERFRLQAGKVKSAKTAGLVIILGGGALLIALAFVLYYYLFRAPAPVVQVEPSAANNQPGSEAAQSATGLDQPNAPVQTATATESAALPADNSLVTSTASTTPEAIEQEVNPGLKPALDSDNDSLTDVEETLLGTSTSTPDSEGDGYLDGHELVNLYDPASKGKLTDNPAVALYENQTFNYDVLYPKVWEQSSSGGDDSVMLRSADNQFIQLVVQPNPDRQALDQWYEDQLGVATINESDRVSGTNWQGIKNLDGLTLYLTDSKQNYIYSLTYNPGQGNTLEYVNIFQMMIKSFTLKE